MSNAPCACPGSDRRGTGRRSPASWSGWGRRTRRCGRVTLAVETALRRGELCRVAQADITGPVVRLTDTKNGRARAVPLSTRARAALSGLRPLTPSQLEHRWRRACLADLHWHDLRHEAVTRLAA